MSESPLRRLQARFGARLEEHVQKWVDFCGSAPGFAAMMRYQMGFVDERLQAVSAPGGKQFRPLLCLLSCEAADGDITDALDLAAAIELLHNFSLVHDDIEDRDDTRRHRPTVWKLWGEAQGINVGDAMFALAFRAGLAVPDPAKAVDIARRFGDTALLLTEGQYLDMSFETRADVSHEEYLNMIGKKSAALVEFSVWSGARIAGAGEEKLECLSRFGRGLGTAFQIHDDIMGIWGRREVTGKQSRTDLENRKKTLPVLLASEQAVGTDADLFRTYLSGEGVDMGSLLDALDRLDVAAEAKRAIEQYLNSALDALRSARLSPDHEQQLADVAVELTGYGSATSWGIVSNR